MATTTRPITELAIGIRDTTGTVVASGKARFYLPGTLTPTAIYSDSVCTSAITQPLTLNAGGQYISAYALEATRMIVKDSTESTTYYDGLVNVNRHDAVYITSPYYNGGAETTLEAVLASLGTNIGTDGNYLESAGATARSFAGWLGQLVVSVKDFAAVGDGAADDTAAIQAAYDRVKVRGGGWVFWPVGTYKTTAAITIDTASVNTMGAGRASIVKNFGTTTNTFTVNLGSALDSKMVFKDIAITANTTSSGAGITFTNGDKPLLIGVGVDLHRTGISTSAVTGAKLHDVLIGSTDDNAAAVGVSLGLRGQITSSEIASGTTNGTGISVAGIDSRAVDCAVTKFATGVNLTAAGSRAKGVVVTSATTGISIAASQARAVDCTADTCTTGFSLAATNAIAVDSSARSCTTGFSVGAFALCRVTGNVGASNTTDLAVNASATTLIEHSNAFTTLSDSATTPHSWLKDRAKVLRVTKTTDSTTTPAITPTPQTCDIYVLSSTTSGALASVTINATSTTGLVDGQDFHVVLARTNAGSGTPTPTWNAQYSSPPSSGTLNSGQGMVVRFVWNAGSAKWIPLNATVSVTGGGGTGANW